MTRKTNHLSPTITTKAGQGVAGETGLLVDLGAWFAARGMCVYLVGGAVRDRLLGRTSPDLDLAVNGPAVQTAHELAAAWQGAPVDLDLSRDTARVVLTRRPGRPEIDLQSFSGAIEDDLRLRDFTINALAVPLADTSAPDWRAVVIDPTGGLADLHRRELRWVSPEAPDHDPLRLLRAVRLAAVLDFTLPPETREVVERLAPAVTRAAPERIRDEVFAVLSCPGPAAAGALAVCCTLGLTGAVWDEAAANACPALEPDWQSGLDALRRLAEWLPDGAGPDRLVLRRPEALAAWLSTPEAANRTRAQLTRWFAFIAGIAPRGPGEKVQTVACQTLRLSRRERSLARTVGATAGAVRAFLSHGPTVGHQRLRFFRRVGGAAPYALLTAAARLPTRLLPRVAETLDEYFAQGPTAKADALVTGRDLSRRFGSLRGRRLGKLLRLLEEAHADGLITTPAEALDFARRALTNPLE